MNENLKAVLYQALGYSMAMMLGLGIVSFLQRGFLFKFIMVKASMGRKILIRLKLVTHWDYAVGSVDEGDLVWGKKDKRKRVNNIKQDHIYRSLGVNWIDLDGKDYSILPPHDNTAIEGFDPEKQESLITRALYKPPMDDPQKKIILVLMVVLIVLSLASVYFAYNILNQVGVMKAAVDSLKAGMVVATG